MKPNLSRRRKLIEGEEEIKDDKIKVVCRIRPPNTREIASKKCLTVTDSKNIDVALGRYEQKQFTFDYTADEGTSQEELYDRVGRPLLHNSFLQGYNATIM